MPPASYFCCCTNFSSKNIWQYYLPVRCYASAGICYDISVCLSVCESVLHACFVSPDRPIILVLHHQGSMLNSGGFPLMGVPNTRGEKIARFLTNKLVYLGNSARYGHSCCRSWIGDHTQAIEWWYFRWLSDPNPQFQSHPTVRRRMSRKQCMLCPAT